MSRVQLVVLLSAVLLFSGLYWGFDTKPPRQRDVERSRALQGESTSPEQILSAATAQLSPDSAAVLSALEQQLQALETDVEKVSLYKALAAFWFRNDAPIASGLAAQQAAELENTDAAWSVAGATYFQALSAEKDPLLRDFCAKRAVKAFESAASLQPEVVEHRVNLALVYAEQPPPDNPMQAVLILRDLEAKYPDAPAVYNALGRLAIKTQQWERAIQRLEKAYSLDPDNPFTPCLLSKAYAGAGQSDKADTFAKRCRERQ